MFYGVYPFVTYLLTLPRIYRKICVAYIRQCDGCVEVHLFYSLPVSVMVSMVSVM
jgi:hypothetical protein